MQAQTLATSLSSILFPQHDLLIHKCMFSSLTLGCAGQYSHTLAPFFPAPTPFDTTSVLITLHFESNGYFMLFLEYYKLDQDFEFFFDSFKLAFQYMLHLLASGLYGMTFEIVSPRRFNEWILSIVPTLLSYRIGSHSTPNCMHPWSGSPFNHDQTWSLSHCSGGNIISTHKLPFMPLIPWNVCNTFFPTLIWSCN